MSLFGFSWRKLNVLRRARAFGRDERGATMMEFAILGVPFFIIIGAILETAVVFLASQMLDSAVQDASRLILTGQAQSQTPTYTVTDFRTAICNSLYNLFNCDNLQISVKVVSNFASATTPASPLDPTDPSKWTLASTFDPGTGSSVIMVQVYYKWPVIMSFNGLGLATSADNTRLLGTVRVFANEPFTS